MITKFKDLQHQRVYIGNFVKRHYTGSKACVNCRKEPTTIVHNVENPYLVSFICDDCRLGLDTEQLASLKKVNLLDYVEKNKKYTSTKNIVMTDELKNTIEGILNSDVSLMEYLKKHDLPYHRYKASVKLYEKEIGPIKKKIQTHLESMRRAKISETMKEIKSANKNA